MERTGQPPSCTSVYTKDTKTHLFLLSIQIAILISAMLVCLVINGAGRTGCPVLINILNCDIAIYDHTGSVIRNFPMSKTIYLKYRGLNVPGA